MKHLFLSTFLCISCKPAPTTEVKANQNLVPQDFLALDTKYAATDCGWVAQQLHLPQAQALFQARKIVPGAGVIIGHMDTGILPHPSVVGSSAKPNPALYIPQPGRDREGHVIAMPWPQTDFVDGDNVPYSTDTTFPKFGHGTSTASLIVGLPYSATELSPGGKTRQVEGLVPGARLIPMRVANNFFILRENPDTRDVTKVANGIRHAVDLGARVITLSLGVAFDTGGWRFNSNSWENDKAEIVFEKKSSNLMTAIDYAVNNGAIVVAAGGQGVPLMAQKISTLITQHAVPAPARFKNVIAVTGTQEDGSTWADNIPDPSIDVAAPAAGVCHARILLADAGDPEGINIDDGARHIRVKYTVKAFAGTSYSTTYVASAAAMWLSYHGIQNLEAKYGKQRVALAFRTVLTQSGVDTPAGWKTDHFGAGRLNLEKLLNAPLPDAANLAADWPEN